MAWGRRCDTGCESWPDDERYEICPGCCEETTRHSNLEPLTKKEANEREFELYYGAWDRQGDPGRLASDAPDARGIFAPVTPRLALPPGPTG